MTVTVWYPIAHFILVLSRSCFRLVSPLMDVLDGICEECYNLETDSGEQEAHYLTGCQMSVTRRHRTSWISAYLGMCFPIRKRKTRKNQENSNVEMNQKFWGLNTGNKHVSQSCMHNVLMFNVSFEASKEEINNLSWGDYFHPQGRDLEQKFSQKFKCPTLRVYQTDRHEK